MMAVVGSEEIYPKLGESRLLARLTGAPYFPITPTFPALGPLGVVPLPSKWRIEFCDPVDLSGYGPEAADDKALLFDISERILDVAQHLVIENGFAATSVDQVIKAAGTSKGAFFHHFDSKLDLARAEHDDPQQADVEPPPVQPRGHGHERCQQRHEDHWAGDVVHLRVPRLRTPAPARARPGRAGRAARRRSDAARGRRSGPDTAAR